MTAGGAITLAPLPPSRPQRNGRLFRRYVVLMLAAVLAASLSSGLIAIWLSYRQHVESLIRLQQEQAGAAAAKIGQFIKEIESQLDSMTRLPWSAVPLEERRSEALRVMRQIPAITELAVLDDNGREQLRLSRLALDVIGSGTDRSNEPLFVEAKTRGIFYGPVYFVRGSEPHMTVAVTGPRHDVGTNVADVNLKSIWDVVSKIKVGSDGNAYVVDSEARLIAHPDISLVLRNIDLGHLDQVKAARAGADMPPVRATTDVHGRQVLTAHATIAPLGWLVFVELPVAEAFAPVYASLLATGSVLLGVLGLAALAALVLARRMIAPIRALQSSAARIGSGALHHRININTGDELEALGDQFNSMARQLEESYATLERKVEERTHQLQLANLAKSRFLAAASHDLRQPLHALNLFVAQLRSERDQAEKDRVVARISAAVGAMNELFNALLDISKLDAGTLAPTITTFPINRLLRRVEATFAGAAREKGLRLRVRSHPAWISSDFILLERIMLNLVSNAVRYTGQGGIVIGCRRRAALLRIEVWDSGIGIPEDQCTNIFAEFYQVAAADRDDHGGLGLGLAIVDRLGRLLGHRIEVTSRVAAGSRFAVSVPMACADVQPVQSPDVTFDQAKGKLVLVIDDDALVLDGMRGLLSGWGCRIITAKSEDGALARLSELQARPDLIISDYRLADGMTGIHVIGRLREALRCRIPALLISGDTAPERLREARASGYDLLHKPVLPITLRAVVSELLKGTTHDSRERATATHNGSSVRRRAAAPNPAPPPR